MHLKPAARHRFSRSEPLCSDGSVHGGLRVAIGARVDWNLVSRFSTQVGSDVFEPPMAPALLR